MRGKLYKILSSRENFDDKREDCIELYKLIYFSEEPLMLAQYQGKLFSYIIDLEDKISKTRLIKAIEGRPRSINKKFIIEYIGEFDYTQMDLVRTKTYSSNLSYIITTVGLGINNAMSEFYEVFNLDTEPSYSDFFRKMIEYILVNKFKINGEST